MPKKFVSKIFNTNFYKTFVVLSYNCLEIAKRKERVLVKENKSAQVLATDEEIIEKIMNHEKKPSETRGVGITNVMSRLDLYYNNREVFEMKSRKNEGTLPYPLRARHLPAFLRCQQCNCTW